MRGPATLLVLLLTSVALAHSEPVEVTTSLTPVPGAVQVAAELVGQTSGLPVRGAAVEVQVSRDTGAPPQQEAVPTGALLGRAPLAAGERGRYTGRLSGLPPGRYVLTVVDTTYRGEAAVAARAFTLSGQPTRVAVVLPVTSTPRRYVVSALLGLSVAPLILVIMTVVTARQRRRAGRGGGPGRSP
ncbi:hypothetical protein [Deinococcus planocerae]|uniref:hypothetical protein n=1 Tax=Deinococcus planocerae TaxID=1737569 RepID=UPI000C7F6D18|nr:hypothetical protein [Deinococcus planocerae]